MKSFTVILIIIVAAGCGSHKYSFRENYIPKPEGTQMIDSIVIRPESDYTCYIRKVYQQVDNRKKEISNPFQKSTEQTAQYYSLTQAVQALPEKKLIEVEYLLYSAATGKFIYITTVPDVNLKYYEKNFNENKPQELNVYDFNTINVGHLEGKYVTLLDLEQGKKSLWEVEVKGDTFSLLRILEFEGKHYVNERSIENSVYGGAVFEKIPRINLIFKTKHVDRTEMAIPVFNFLERKKTETKASYCVYFRFDLPAKTDRRNRLRSNPKPFATVIFKGPKHVPTRPMF